MKYPLYAIRDLKANGFSQPVLYVNENVAKRDFDYRLHNDQSMGFSPNDYDLYHVGYFDSDSGKLEAIELPEMIVNGGQLY